MLIRSFRNPTTALIAALARSLNARMEDAPPEPKNDEEFIKQFSAKMEKAEAAKPAEGDEPEPEPVSEGKDADDEEDTPAGGGEADKDDEGEDADGDDADGDAEPDAGEPSDDDDKDGKDEGDDEDESEFGKRAREANLPTSIDDLPKEAQGIVQKRLKEMESGFTRLMQKQAAFREEQRQFRTEERYRTTHKVEWLAQEILKDPDLEEKVVAELEKLRSDESPYLREAAGVVAKDHRAKAAQEIAEQEAEERKQEERAEAEAREQSEWIAERGSQVETIARKACSKFGIQFDRGVEAAIAYEISESEQGDIDDSRIREIVEEMAAERGRSKRAVLREERKREVQGKTEALRNASPIRPGQGRAGGTTKAKQPRSLEEQMTATAERLFPGEA